MCKMRNKNEQNDQLRWTKRLIKQCKTECTKGVIKKYKTNN